MGKDFSNTLALDLNDGTLDTGSEENAPKQGKRGKSSGVSDSGGPRNLKEQRQAMERIQKERDPRKPATFTLPESVKRQLKEYVLRQELAGNSINQSEVVEQGILMYLRKYDKS